MTEKKEPVTEDDPKQSEAFRKAVRALEAAGELRDIDAEKEMAKVIRLAASRPDQDEKQSSS